VGSNTQCNPRVFARESIIFYGGDNGMTEDVALIILNYNDWKTVYDLIHLIKDYKALNKIIIVDNASKDDSYQRLSLLSNEKIDVIQSQGNKGYAYGNNYGAEYALEKYNPKTLFFANPDVAFEENVVIQIVEALYQKEEYAVGSALVRSGYNVWKLPGFYGMIRSMFLIVHNLEKRRIKKQLLQIKKVAEVDVVEGSFFAIKADIYKKINGLDERTFLYYEENILAKKLKNKGYKEIIVRNCDYEHLHSKSIKKEYKSKAKAFKLFADSYEVYGKYYLNMNRLQKVQLKIFFRLAYFERTVYDRVMKFL